MVVPADGSRKFAGVMRDGEGVAGVELLPHFGECDAVFSFNLFARALHHVFSYGVLAACTHLF